MIQFRHTRLALLALVMGAAQLFVACSEQATQAIFDKQETQIDNFVQATLKKEGTYAVYNKGSVRVVMEKGEETTDSLRTDGVVSFYYALYKLSGTSVSASNLISTNSAEVAGSSWSLSDESAFEIETVKLDESGYVEGLRNGLVGVRGGQECYILFSGEYGFGDRILGTIPANSALVYHIWVNSISNE